MNSIRYLFAHKSSSNHELFNAVAAVQQADHADVVHAAIRMLNHIYVVDKIFQAHLLGEQHPYSSTNTESTPEVDELQFNVAETDGWYEKYVSTASAAELNERVAFKFTDGDTGTMSREEMLLHVITHGAYHRGNVGQMLKSISVVPPRDLLTKFLHVSEPGRRHY
jgi:uncharacterized damage-inducible protein DinB